MAAAAEKIGKADLDVESILDEAYKVPGWIFSAAFPLAAM